MPPNCGRMTQVHLVFNTSASCCMPHATCHAKNHSSRCRLHQRCRTQLRLCLCAAFWVTTRRTEKPFATRPASTATPCFERIVAIKMQGNYFKKHLLRLSTSCGNAALHFRLQCEPLLSPISLSLYLSLSLLLLLLRHSLCQSHWLSSHIRLAFVRAYCRLLLSLSAFPRALRFKFCTRRA